MFIYMQKIKNRNQSIQEMWGSKAESMPEAEMLKTNPPYLLVSLMTI